MVRSSASACHVTAGTLADSARIASASVRDGAQMIDLRTLRGGPGINLGVETAAAAQVHRPTPLPRCRCWPRQADGAESVSAATVLVGLAAPAWAVTEHDDQFLTTMSGPGWTISSPTEFTGYAHMVCDEGWGDAQERRPPAASTKRSSCSWLKGGLVGTAVCQDKSTLGAAVIKA